MADAGEAIPILYKVSTKSQGRLQRQDKGVEKAKNKARRMVDHRLVERMLGAVVAITLSLSSYTVSSFVVVKGSSSSRTSSSQRRATVESDVTEQKFPTATKAAAGDVSPVQIVTEMPPFLPPSNQLKNKYYLLRHGQSTANVAEIISSSRSLAYTAKHGLTDVGYQQGKDSAEQLIDILSRTNNNKDDEKVVFVSSPLARAYQTASACIDGIQEKQQEKDNIIESLDDKIAVHDNLVERYFGKLDAEAIYTYAYVWPLDKFDTCHTAFDVESVAAVCWRIHDMIINDLETKYSDCHLVLVSHADVLQIAQLYAYASSKNTENNSDSNSNEINVGEFSSYRFKNGEVREMFASNLPDPVPLDAPQRGTYEYTLLTQ